MIGIVEFREDEHKHHLHKLHQIKKELCDVIEKLESSEYQERRSYIRRDGEHRDEFDERRGRYNMKDHDHYREGDYRADIVMDGRYRY